MIDLFASELASSLRLSDAQIISASRTTRCYRVRIADDPARYFLKVVSSADVGRLDAELDGLEMLSRYLAPNSRLRVPEIVHVGRCVDLSGILLEWVDVSPPNAAAFAQLGAGLAELHYQECPEIGGPDNFIGDTPQHNATDDSWPSFFVRRRLVPQRQLAVESGRWRGSWDAAWERAIERVRTVLPDDVHVSPLHGDLWRGNALHSASGVWYLIDPAFYGGDGVSDVAMMKLFGGFAEEAFDSYAAHSPPEVRSRVNDRITETVYNLYHLLNHLNLFGNSYGDQVERAIRSLSD